MWGSWIKMNLINNIQNLRVPGHAIGVGLVNENLSNLDPTGIMGFLTDLHVDINCNYIAKPVWLPDSSSFTYAAGKSGAWANDFFIKVKGSGYREIHIGNFGRGSYHDIFLQTDINLTEVEKDTLYSGYIGSCNLKIVLADLYNLYESGWWQNKLGVILGSGVYLEQGSRVEIGDLLGYPPLGVKGVDTDSDIKILAEKSNNRVFISELHNKFITLNKQRPATFKYYSGASIDFDSPTPTIGSELEITSITGSYTQNLFSGKGYAPTFYFKGSTDPDKDFIEIAFNPISYYVTPTVHFMMEGTKRIFNKIQLIGFKSSGNPNISTLESVSINNNYARRSYKLSLPRTTYTAFAIRIIGSGNIKKTATISNGNPAVITSVSHGMSGAIQLSTTGTLPTPLVPDTNYYIVGATTNSFNLSLTDGGTAIATTSAGSGTHSISKTSSIALSDLALETGENVSGSNFAMAIDGPRFKYRAMLSQTGTAAPTIVSESINTTGRVVTTSYISVGAYRVTCTGTLTSGKTFPQTQTAFIYNGLSFIGTVRMTRYSDSVYDINTWNPAGTLANGILNNQIFEFEVGW